MRVEALGQDSLSIERVERIGSFDVNEDLWHRMGLERWEDLAEYCSTKQLSQRPIFRSIIKLTK